MTEAYQTQPNAIAASVAWLADLMTGGAATIIAILCVAGFGLLVLSGRIPKKRGIQLVLGCFIVFGASSIASGLMNVLSERNAAPPPIAPPTPVAATTAPAPPSVPYDPYAGAALPSPR